MTAANQSRLRSVTTATTLSAGEPTSYQGVGAPTTSTGSVAISVSRGGCSIGTTTDGEQVRVRGCDLFDLDDAGLVRRKDSYWKIVQP